jgi:hypothetical protein
MKRAYTTAVALLLCSTAALAQSSGGSGGSGGTSGGATGSTGTTQGRSSSQNPSTQGTTPGVTAPSPSEGATTQEQIQAIRKILINVRTPKI